jgi:hypothetical protein
MMTRRGVMGLVCLAWLVGLGGAPADAATRDDQLVREADQALFRALSKSDGAAFARLLEPKFTWTTSAGQALDTKALLNALPKPGAQVGANLKLHVYGHVAVLTTELETVHALRVWVKGRGGWRALLYHEVAVTAPPAEAATRVEADCENPCRSLPYAPRTAAARAVITAWQALEQAVAAGNGTAWATHVADEFVVVDNAGAHDKPARLTAINQGGSAPPPLVAATMFDYRDAVVMTALHQRYRGKPMRVSRIWIKRGKAWLLAISYQTVIQAAKVG